MEAYPDKSTPNHSQSAMSHSDQFGVDNASFEYEHKPVNNYQIQSYYTSSYKLLQRQTANSQGAGVIDGVMPQFNSNQTIDYTLTKTKSDLGKRLDF